MTYPPYTITKSILNLVAQISELMGRFHAQSDMLTPQLRRINRIRSIHSSLAIENNTLTLDEVTAVISGKRVLAPPREVQEVHGAFAAYEQMDKWDPAHLDDLLEAHSILMRDLVNTAGQLRNSNVAVFSDKEVVHMAPPADIAKEHLQKLLNWLGQADEHPLVASSIFHYEFEFLHPFEDGNGRMGRLWQTLILSKWKPVLAYLPVESVIRDKQAEYYAAIADSSKQGEATIFVEFMLQALQKALIQSINTTQVDTQVTTQVKSLLIILQKLEEASINELMQNLTLRSVKNFRLNYINPALEAGLIERTQPDAPRSPTQKYRLTAASKIRLQNFSG